MRLDAAKNTRITAGQDINVSAGGEITLAAGDGTFMKLGGGKLTLGTSGSATIHAASHSMTGPMSAAAPEQAMTEASSGLMKFDEQVRLVEESGSPAAHQAYSIYLADEDRIVEGLTDENGYTQRVVSETPKQLELDSTPTVWMPYEDNEIDQG